MLLFKFKQCIILLDRVRFRNQRKTKIGLIDKHLFIQLGLFKSQSHIIVWYTSFRSNPNSIILLGANEIIIFFWLLKEQQ